MTLFFSIISKSFRSMTEKWPKKNSPGGKIYSLWWTADVDWCNAPEENERRMFFDNFEHTDVAFFHRAIQLVDLDTPVGRDWRYVEVLPTTPWSETQPRFAVWLFCWIYPFADPPPQMKMQQWAPVHVQWTPWPSSWIVHNSDQQQLSAFALDLHCGLLAC